MVAHPKTMQTVIDRRWHELRVEVDRERRAMTAREQSLRTTPLATLRLRAVNAVQMLRPIFGVMPSGRQTRRLQSPVCTTVPPLGTLNGGLGRWSTR